MIEIMWMYGDFVKAVNKRTRFDIVSNDLFLAKIKKMLEKPDSDKLLGGILREFDENQKLQSETKIKINSDFSVDYLQKIGFIWPEINEDYLIKFFDYFKEIGFMNL